jgi:type I restriction enzyme S subunit
MKLTKRKLGDIAKFVRGITFKPEDVLPEGNDESVVCFRTKNVQVDLELSDVLRLPRKFVKRQEQFITRGDMLMSTANSWNLVGKLSWVPKLNYEATAGGFISILRADPELVVPRFLYHWAASPMSQEAFRNCGRQTTNISNLDFARALALEVKLPPLEDQKRIATLLDKADALRRKRQEALRLTDDFLRSTFLDMFGDPLTNTRQLPMKPLREFGEIVTGNTPPRSEPENFGSAVEWIKSDNINTPNYYLTSAEERLSPLGAAKARKVPANSILVTCIAGSPSCIGNVALTNREVAFNQQINAVVPAKDTDPFFLFTQFLVGKKKIQNASTNGMKGMVSKGTFSEIEFLAPPEAKQREFGNIFRHMEELHRKNEDAFTATETLFSALQQRAFSGQL